MKKDFSHLIKSKNVHTLKTIISIVFVVIGTIVLCTFLAVMQNVSAERSQEKSSKKILEEVDNTLKDNDQTVNSIIFEYNEINQTTISTLAEFANGADILYVVKNSSSMTETELENRINSTTDEIDSICKSISVSGMLVFDSNNKIVLGNDQAYIGPSVSENTYLTEVLTLEQVNILKRYAVDEKGEVTVNGTYLISNGEKEYEPITTTYLGEQVYVYSTLFDKDVDNSYYILTYVPCSLIEKELAGLKSIDSVLSGITVGKSGFLFAIDREDEVFTYFVDGTHDLSGLDYNEYGLTEDAAKDNYTGYQVIDGKKYFCVTREFNSKTYGEFTVVAAVVSQKEIVEKNLLTIIFSIIAFVLVAGVVSGYGLILRRDIADHILQLEDKHKQALNDENQGNFSKFTDEEINERTKILLEEDIITGRDKKLARKNMGVRTAKGKQFYFSKYIFTRLASVLTLGLLVIFFVSFFSQTLLGLNDVTSISTKRLEEIVETIRKNEDNSETIQVYVDNQFLSKSRLLSYILEETPEILFEDSSMKKHYLFEKDENGIKSDVFFDEYPTVKRFAISNSSVLETLCEENDVKSIFVFSDDGKVLATNRDLWNFKISQDPLAQSYPFNDIIDDAKDFLIQETTESEVEGFENKYIGTVFFYYTYLDNGDVQYASKSDYESFISGTWTKGDITKHRSLIQVGVDESTVEHLFGTTRISYILENMYVYGDKSFFIAFDKTDDHKVVYSPYSVMIGKSAQSLGVSDSAFTVNERYNGFQTIDGTKFYQSFELIGDYYIATAIPTQSIYTTRNQISLYTVIFSGLFIVLASFAFTISSDKADNDYCNTIKYKGRRTENHSFVLSSPSGKRRQTRSVSSRYTKITWNRKTAEEKLSTILMIYLMIAFITLIIVLFFALRNKSNETIFTYIFSGVWEKGFNVFAITEALIIMIIIAAITKLAQICVRSFCGTLGARVETTGNLIVSVLKYGGVLGGLFYCLYLFGLNTASLLTSAGILSIVIGLGAQSLISDIIAGIFIVFEGSFRVGDIVTIEGFRGMVLEIGLRTTKVEDISRNIKIFNNSAISGVLNMTKESSFASIVVAIEYGESLERVEKVLKDAFPKIRRKLPQITDGPFYKGVDELGDNSVNIRITAQCTERDRIQLSRDLNREIFLLFNRNNINIPFPQVTLSYLENKNKKDETHVSQEANDFVNEQRKASMDKESSEGL